MKMGKKVREYKSGDFIFAKVKGYPAWPARVQRLNGKKYFVYFYGTGETANLPPNMIFDYSENKDKFLAKSVKRRDFNDGVKQIEHDFANNVPLEQVIGVIGEATPDANDTGNESAASETMDDTGVDTTAVDETISEDTNTTQNDTVVEDSDDTGGLVIDEGKKGRKSTAKTPAKEAPKPKEPKTPRGKGKKEDNKEDEVDKKEEEIVSRSGRKIRPKRYIDEQTEENATLPSPAPKKRRAASPQPEEKKEKEKEKSEPKEKAPEKNIKHFNALTQSELEDIKEPFKSDDTEKENILIAYLPSGQYVGIKLFQSRPTTFKNEAARLNWDKMSATNAITLKHQLEKGQITSQSVLGQLVTDLNLTDEEKATLDKERETEEKKSRVQFLKTEMKLIELDTKIKTCLCLEKADTDLCLKLLDELLELDVKPLMLLKHPTSLETVKRLRAYVGNTPSWDLSEDAAILFAKQAHRIRKQAEVLYKALKELFTTPEGLSFWEYFSERVLHFKKVTSKLSQDELLEMVHEPIEMSQQTSHTMKTSVDAANEEEPPQEEEDSQKKKSTPAKAKKQSQNNIQKTAVKRQSSRKLEEKDKETEANKQTEENLKEVEESSEKEIDKDDSNKEKDDNTKEVASNNKEVKDTKEKDTKENNKSAKEKETKENNKAVKEKEAKENNKAVKEKDTKESNKATKEKDTKENNKAAKEKETKDNKTTKEKDSKENNKESKESSKETKDSSKEVKDNKEVEAKEKESQEKKDESPEKEKQMEVDKETEDSAEKSPKETEEKEEKDKQEGEPRAKRTRENKKTEAPPPRSPAKRKAKS